MKNKKHLKEVKVFLLNELVSKTITFSDIDVGVCNIEIPPVFREVFLDFYEPDIAKMCKRIVKLKDGVIIEDKKVKQILASSYV